MKLRATIGAGVLLACAPLTLVAADNPQWESIKRLGQLNGVALHCKAVAETQRMKRALVKNLPKRRQLGELFDIETHDAFLAFIERNTSCPSPEELALQVDEAIRALEIAYADQKEHN